jgi:hypothetical protein
LISTPKQSITITSKRLDEVQTLSAPGQPRFPKDEVKLKQSKSRDQVVNTTSSTSKIPSKKILEPIKKSSTLQTSSTSSNLVKKNIPTSLSAGQLSLMSYSTSGKTVRESNSNYTPSITNIGD